MKRPLAGLKILLVDDDEANIDLMEEILRSYGALPTLADSANTALEALKTYQPDLILLDLSMPAIDGWQLHTMLRRDPTLTKTPIVALTAHAMQGDGDKVMAAGFDGYLTKPVTYKTLAKLLLNYIFPEPPFIDPPKGLSS